MDRYVAPKAFALAVLALGLGLVSGCPSRSGAPREHRPGDPNVLVAYVACGLVPVVEAARARFEAENAGKSVHVEAGEPSDLFSRIQDGADADIFVCLGESEIGVLEREGFMNKSYRRHIGAYRIALATPAGRPTMESYKDLMSPEVETITMPLPGMVSLGTYGKRALERVGVWSGIQGKLQHSESGLRALEALGKGEVDAAVVYDPCPVLSLPDKVPAGSVAVGPTVSEPNGRPVQIEFAVHQRTPRLALAQRFIAVVRSDELRPELAAIGVPLEGSGAEPDGGTDDEGRGAEAGSESDEAID